MGVSAVSTGVFEGAEEVAHLGQEPAREAREAPLPDAVSTMQKTDTDAWRALRTAAYGAYYTSGRVQAAIGYTGQLASPFDPDEKPEYMSNGMIDAVLARGPIWRQAPK